MSNHPNLAALKDKVVDAVVCQSEGIFLWAALAVKALAQESTSEKVLESLDNLPISLDDLYVGIFERQSLELTKESFCYATEFSD